MVFLKQAEIRDATAKYGFAHKGVFVKEAVKRGEPIYTCEVSKCDYLQLDEVNSGKTSDELNQILKEYPDSSEFIIKYLYMIDDDIFDFPRNYKEQILTEDCMFFNHSCAPNCGFQSLDSALVVAIRDIEAGEELTYDYQFMDTEASHYTGIECKCGSFKCCGVLKFDRYRNVDWQNAYYKYSGAYVQKKIDELKTKWHSSRCFLKYYIENDQPRQLGLTALEKIAKHDLVAIYSDPNNISIQSHNIRHSDNPTCYLIDNQVYASADIEPSTELTLNFTL